MITTQSIEYTGEAIINMSGLSRFEANVKEFVLGRWQRSSGNFSLAQTNRIEATKVFVSDSHDSDGGESYLRLGRKNEIYTDELYVGAGTGDYNVTGKGTLQFQTLPEGERPSVLIRGKDGVSAVDCTVAFMSSSLGKMNNRQMTAGMNFLGGTVDAKFGKLLVAQHQAYQGSGKTGGATGYISMDAGLVEAENATFGRTIYRSSEAANPARGTLNVLGGTFRAQSLMLAENEGSAGRPYGIVNVAGDGLVEVTGNVMLGKRKGGTTEALAQINLTNGVMRVEGNVEPDVAYKTNIVSEVHLVGGRLEAEEGTLRIERGVLELAAGSAEVGRLVTTNELCRTVVRLSDAGTASVEANESVLLGGTVEVVLEEGFEPLKGTVWQVVTGSAEREGTFAEEVLPELFRVAYTRGGYHVMYDNPATILLVR